MFMGEMTAGDIDALLQTETIAHVACQRDGQPYVVPMNFVFDGEAIIMHSLEGEKVRILRENPRVCVQVEHVDNPRSWRSVQVFGRFEELRGEEAHAALVKMIHRLLPGSANGHDPFAPPGMEDRVVMFRVAVGRRSGRFARP